MYNVYIYNVKHKKYINYKLTLTNVIALFPTGDTQREITVIKLLLDALPPIMPLYNAKIQYVTRVICDS